MSLAQVQQSKAFALPKGTGQKPGLGDMRDFIIGL